MNKNKKPLFLVVEDDARLNAINRQALESEGYAVLSAFTVAEALDILKTAQPDVILLDVKLPDGNGFDLCREIRNTTSAHIIFLTSVTESSGEMEGLVAGGDDYLRKPYRIELLRERAKSVLRRREMVPQVITKGSISFNLVANTAFLNGKDMLLTPREFSLLLVFAENKDKIMSAEHLYETAWKMPIVEGINSLQSIISKLRKKLENSEYDIIMRRGQGYIFTSL